jgi:diguanylate cyclase (GGDEF)-like protein
MDQPSAAPTATVLHTRSARYGALDLVSQPVWVFDIDQRRVHWANRAAVAVWNAPTLAELCARDLGHDMSESVARRLVQYQRDFITAGASFNELWTLHPAGKPVSLNVVFSGHRLDDGRMAMLCEAQPAQADAPESLRSVEALLHTAVMITLYDTEGRALYRNPAARASATAHDEQLSARIVGQGGHTRLLDEARAAGHATLTLPVLTVQGKRWHEVSARLCKDAVTGQQAVLVSEVDVSAIKRTEARARHQSLHDPLTGLPNRSHVMQHFVDTIAGLPQAEVQAALIFIDLDHFKDVNDTLGHAAGDQLLVEVARRLRQATRSSDLVARLGGDEFLILMVSSDIRAEVDRVRTRLLQEVSRPVLIGATEVCITPSLGVSLYPRDGADIETLLRNADLAMYTAKDRGRNDLAYFDEAMAHAVLDRTTLETDLRHALDHGEFELHYQPRVCVPTGRILGAEALVRWRHPTRGLVMPDVFIGPCENTGLIHRLGAFVFQQAARQQAAWARTGQVLQVSVNLSAHQLRDADIAPAMAQWLQDAGCAASGIQVEITESALVGHDARTLESLQAMHSMGLAIALDDFGTGYSNLAYLQRFPISTLKIDRSFVQGIDTNRPLAELIVAMCRLMKLAMVAEGVETEEQMRWVAAQGIESCQGFLFARPLPAGEFEALLASQDHRGQPALASLHNRPHEQGQPWAFGPATH